MYITVIGHHPIPAYLSQNHRHRPRSPEDQASNLQGITKLKLYVVFFSIFVEQYLLSTYN